MLGSQRIQARAVASREDERENLFRMHWRFPSLHRPGFQRSDDIVGLNALLQ
jgi:hypothetical protein